MVCVMEAVVGVSVAREGSSRKSLVDSEPSDKSGTVMYEFFRALLVRESELYKGVDRVRVKSVEGPPPFDSLTSPDSKSIFPQKTWQKHDVT